MKIQPAASQFDKKLALWVNRLNDLSRRNQLLYFKPTHSLTLQVAFPYARELFQRIVDDEKTLYFPESTTSQLLSSSNNDESISSEKVTISENGPSSVQKKDAKAGKPNEITPENKQDAPKVLRNLYSKARSAQEEHGIHILYLAFGMLRWTETQSEDSELISSPLVLVPVNLKRKSVLSPFNIELADEDLQINLSLRVKLEQDFNLKLPDLPEQDGDILNEYWSSIRDLVEPFNWSISEQVMLSVFKPAQQILINDLIKNQERIRTNPLLMHLINPDTPINLNVSDLTTAPQLDARVTPHNTFQVLDADSSQQEVIEAAKAGLSFIVQGPPGTGKSQTITNIIAEFIAANKTVLFVSEKMAALDVVYRRLQATDLDQYCLVLHSEKTSRKSIVDELTKSSEGEGPLRKHASPEIISRSLNELVEHRQKLNRYFHALHHIPPPTLTKLEKSAYQAIAELSRQTEKDLPSVRFSDSDLRTTNSEKLRKRWDELKRLPAYAQTLQSPDTNPWAGVQQTEDLISNQRQDIEHMLDVLSEIDTRFTNDFWQLSNSLKQPNPLTLKQVRQLLTLFDGSLMKTAAHFSLRYPISKEQKENLEQICRFFKPEIMQMPIDSIIDQLEKHLAQVRLMRGFSGEYRRLSKELSDIQLLQANDTKRLDMLKVARRLLNDLGDEHSQLQRDELNTLHSQVMDHCQIISTAAQTLRHLYGNKPPLVLRDVDDIPFEEISNWAKARREQLGALSDWIECQRVLSQMREIGLESFINQMRGTSFPLSKWPEVYWYSFHEHYLDLLMQEFPVLREFDRDTYIQAQAKFQELDRRVIKLTRDRIQAQRMPSQSVQSWVGISASSEENILRSEARKQRKHKPLRKLFAEIPNLILKLRPCLLMSPLTVGQYLDPNKYEFDLVIFDEASQIPPEHAIGAIIRAKQVIIAGDRKQLPPTRFFDTVENDSDVEDENEVNSDVVSFDSILDEADAANFPSKMLLWHYRSKDESLIAFSNFHFYNNRLMTFPSSIRPLKDEEKYLEFVPVPLGIYQRGSGVNRIEAEHVVKIMAAHIRANPKISLGVITFNQAQQHLIELLWEKALQQDSELRFLVDKPRAEELFVKNLESVQGDERDIIIFSIGYGKDETGRLRLNFGPLNQAGGERRLNVSITRARQKVQLVTSIQPEDIDLRRSESKGLELLQQYMRFTRDGLQALQTEPPSGDRDALQFDSPFEKSVYDALTQKDLILHSQVGVSGYRIDLAVVDSVKPSRYILGIECDGATYHSSSTARERDRLRQDILENLGWRIHRIWSQAWFKSPAHEIEKIMRLLEDIRDDSHTPLNDITASVETVQDKTPKVTVPNDESTKNVMRDQERLSEETIPGWVEPYEVTKLPTSQIDLTSDLTQNQAVSRLFQKLVEQEGPIRFEIAIKRIADACGVHKVGNRIHENTKNVVNALVKQGFIERRDEFLWWPNTITITVRARYGDNEKRSIVDIAPEEIELCMCNLLRDTLSLTEDDLLTSTARIFGIRRIGKDVRAALASRFEALLKTNRIVRVDERIRLIDQK